MKHIIIPTLNEAENIGVLIKQIYQYLDPSDTMILVVDDNSIDTTHDVVREMAQEFPHVKLIVRRNERGLGTAVRKGASLIDEGPVVVMDADLSHHPRHLPAMFQKLSDGADVVVGSRYVSGGGIRGWPGSRVAVSQVATLIAKILFRTPVNDPMSGFVGCRSPKILVDGIDYADFKFLLELLVKNRTLKVGEVPITFQDRLKGSSKLKAKTIGLYLSLVLKLMLESGSRNRQ
ncbi:MAG: glycosyltransferase [Candidatus Lokiarchaeota archaeon]|nr:glycosyltransferase [Candidatus Lokiarchaeota archaeon]